MDRKILVGSIIAVVILVLVSLTSVVGYSSVRSSTIAETSPLFNIRTNRAIGEESKILTSNYFGRGNTLPFPKRDDRTVLVQKVVNTIRKMDDETFDRFIASVIDYGQKDGRLKSINPDEIREAFNLVRDNDEPIPILEDFPSVADLTCRSCTFGHGFLGIRNCIRMGVFNIIWTIAVLLYYLTQMISFILCGL